MKCCKKWKEATVLPECQDDKLRYIHEELNLCQDCGSSLKEEARKNRALPAQESKWCECNQNQGKLVSLGEELCVDCSKPIKPTPKLPKKLGGSWNLHAVKAKQDQLIDYLKEREVEDGKF